MLCLEHDESKEIGKCSKIFFSDQGFVHKDTGKFYEATNSFMSEFEIDINKLAQYGITKEDISNMYLSGSYVVGHATSAEEAIDLYMGSNLDIYKKQLDRLKQQPTKYNGAEQNKNIRVAYCIYEVKHLALTKTPRNTNSSILENSQKFKNKKEIIYYSSQHAINQLNKMDTVEQTKKKEEITFETIYNTLQTLLKNINSKVIFNSEEELNQFTKEKIELSSRENDINIKMQSLTKTENELKEEKNKLKEESELLEQEKIKITERQKLLTELLESTKIVQDKQNTKNKKETESDEQNEIQKLNSIPENILSKTSLPYSFFIK